MGDLNFKMSTHGGASPRGLVKILDQFKSAVVLNHSPQQRRCICGNYIQPDLRFITRRLHTSLVNEWKKSPSMSMCRKCYKGRNFDEMRNRKLVDFVRKTVLVLGNYLAQYNQYTSHP